MWKTKAPIKPIRSSQRWTLVRAPRAARVVASATLTLAVAAGVAGCDRGPDAQAVAELQVEEMDSGAQWLIKSWDRRIDRAIAEALSAERCFSAAESCEFVQTLTDEVLVRIADAGAVHIGRAGIGVGAGERCPFQDGGGAGSSEQYGCLCGCHFAVHVGS